MQPESVFQTVISLFQFVCFSVRMGKFRRALCVTAQLLVVARWPRTNNGLVPRTCAAELFCFRGQHGSLDSETPLYLSLSLSLPYYSQCTFGPLGVHASSTSSSWLVTSRGQPCPLINRAESIHFLPARKIFYNRVFKRLSVSFNLDEIFGDRSKTFTF